MDASDLREQYDVLRCIVGSDNTIIVSERLFQMF